MRLGSIVIDSDNVEELSSFYAEFLGWTKNVQTHDGEKWITVVKEDYSETPLVFQENSNYKKPKWPSDSKKQQQMVHLDFYVRMDEFESSVDHAVKCGAKVAEEQFSDGWKVIIDPSGHPFCIIPIPNDIYEERYR